jgi:putative intracellular protease/amidase
MSKVLMVLTSHDRLGNTGRKTGFWLEEFATPYFIFKDAGLDVTLASPKGGQPPLDPKSDDPGSETESMRRFKGDREAQAALAHTVPLSDISPDDYDAVFYPGGHGPLWDLSEDRHSIRLIEALYAAGKPVGAVCHGPAALRHAKAPGGSPLVRGKSVTGVRPVATSRRLPARTCSAPLCSTTMRTESPDCPETRVIPASR